MKKCPYCAEDIQDGAIKCKHCGEWFEKRGISETEKIASGLRVVPRHEKINQIFHQGNIFVDVGGIPDIPENLPEKLLNYPNKNAIPDIMEARTYLDKAERKIRYSPFQFKGWGIYDMVLTNERLILVRTALRARGVINPSRGLVPALLMAAFEKYQQMTKDKRIDLDILHSLVADGLAIAGSVTDIGKIIIAQEKLSFGVDGLQTSCRVVIQGEFLYKNEKLKGFIGFLSGRGKTDTKKDIEQNFPVKAIVLDEKIDVNADYRILLQ